MENAIAILLELTRRLTEAKKLEDSLSDVTDAALRLMPADHASIRILNESNTELLTGARSGSGTDEAPLSFRPGEGVAGWVVEHGKAVVVPDVAADPRFVALPAQGFSIGSMVAVPLWSAGRVIGVLSVSAATVHRLGDEHVDLALLLANCTVPAIEKARLVRLALTDDQTRTFNRRYEMPRLEEEIARARRSGAPLSLLMLDLDHFKRVNDQFGHAQGDRVLEAFADRVRSATRREDVFIRRGGEEFVLIMPGTDAPEARAVAQRIVDCVAKDPFFVGDGKRVTQTVSAGVATWRQGEDGFEFEHRADMALYRAKALGRNRVSVSGEAEAA